jgi:hypothetical protein
MRSEPAPGPAERAQRVRMWPWWLVGLMAGSVLCAWLDRRAGDRLVREAEALIRLAADG